MIKYYLSTIVQLINPAKIAKDLTLLNNKITYLRSLENRGKGNALSIAKESLKTSSCSNS